MVADEATLEDDRELRALDLLALPAAVEKIAEGVWRVRSSTGRGFYRVEATPKGWTCECEDWAERRRDCKHIRLVLRTLDPSREVPIEIIVGDGPRYSQDWPSYDAAQQAEFVDFDSYLWDLLEQVPEPVRPPGKRGKNPISLRIALRQTIRTVHLGKSMRRARGELLALSLGGTSIFAKPANYAVPSRILNREATTEILLRLIALSALPLRELEAGGTVAIDSTGFCTTCMGAYCTEKHDPGRRHGWIKAHVIVGTRTHAVLAVAVTDERGADSPQAIPLLRELIALEFHPSAFVGDKAYQARALYDELERLGIQVFIPFRYSSTGQSRGSPLYRKMWLQFTEHRAEFDAKYHARSNVESVFSAVKRRMGEALLCKNKTARLNEALSKLLAYNIGVLIHETYENGIQTGPVARSRSKPQSSSSELRPLTACDSIQAAVTDSIGHS